MSIDKYIHLKTSARVMPDVGNYKIEAGEMNPFVIERFFNQFKGRVIFPVVWEPFAGTSFKGSSKVNVAYNVANDIGVKLISYGLCPQDDRIEVCNSVNEGPKTTINGMLFHPPYFGSPEMSRDLDDLSFMSCNNEVGYKDKLSKVIDNGVDCMADNGVVCAVGRDYRYNGKRVRLDLWYLELFEKKGFTLNEVWFSPPDIVLLFGLVI
jgi:hypothetical protein